MDMHEHNHKKSDKVTKSIQNLPTPTKLMHGALVWQKSCQRTELQRLTKEENKVNEVLGKLKKKQCIFKRYWS